MEEIHVKLSYDGAHRRFKIKGNDPEGLFSDLMSHVAQLSAQSSAFDIAWQDEDGDNIIISRPAELGEAIESRKDDLLRLHTIERTNAQNTLKSEKEVEKQAAPKETSQTNTDGNDAIHGNVVCDVCDATIIGTRYKCILCVDYDLCQNCEKTGVHANHGMLRIVDPMRTYVPWGARLRYTTQNGPHHHGHRSVDPHGVIHRFRMQEKKEQLSEQVAKGMQYLTDIGQVVTSALANFGIDASYEVEVPKEKKDAKTESGEQITEEKKVEKTEEKKPETPNSVPNAPKEEKPDTDIRPLKGRKINTEKKKSSAPSVEHPNIVREFDNLQTAEELYRSATDKLEECCKPQFTAEDFARRVTERMQPQKVSESRRMQDAEVRKERHTFPPFGVHARGPLGCRSWRGSHSRNPFEFRDTSDFARCERRRQRDEEGNSDEQKVTRGSYYNEPIGRDHRRWWASARNDWTSPARRSLLGEYDPFEEYPQSLSTERKRTFEKEERPEGVRFEEKKSTETKKTKRSADAGQYSKGRDADRDPVRRSATYFGELARRNRFCRPAEEGLRAAVEEAAYGTDDDDNNCRCFVSRMGRSPLCPACIKERRRGLNKSAHSSQSSFEKESTPPKEVSIACEDQSEKKGDESVEKNEVKQEVAPAKTSRDSYDHCYSTDSSDDSDFEALSYESIPDEVEKSKWPSAPQLSVEQDVSAVVTTVTSEVVNNQLPTNISYPILTPEVEPAQHQYVGEDQGIASRLIDMGFSAEEVFRVVRMHGSNFERCIEEILAKEP